MCEQQIILQASKGDKIQGESPIKQESPNLCMLKKTKKYNTSYNLHYVFQILAICIAVIGSSVLGLPSMYQLPHHGLGPKALTNKLQTPCNKCLTNKWREYREYTSTMHLHE